jgi:hypothetical protein
MWKDVDVITITDSGEFVSFINELCEIGKPIIFDGDLSCSNTGITKLPNNLTVNGILCCTDNGFTKLPNNLLVKNSLDCSGNNLRCLPSDLSVNGSIFLYYNNIVKEIKCIDDSKIIMDHKQRKTYIRVVKINRIKKLITKSK